MHMVLTSLAEEYLVFAHQGVDLHLLRVRLEMGPSMSGTGESELAPRQAGPEDMAGAFAFGVPLGAASSKAHLKRDVLLATGTRHRRGNMLLSCSLVRGVSGIDS